MSEYTIILFYKYIPIDNSKKLKEEQQALCEKLNLKGRVIVATEGINATLEGTNDAIEAYLKEYLSDPRFSDTHIKKSKGTGNAFPKLSVKTRKEIVTLGIDKDYNSMARGKRLSPEELKELFTTKEVGKDFHIVDLRNDYEFKVGRFKGSVLPKLQNFRDVPHVLSELEPLKDKPIITVCTGDVRCEKASGFLAEQGFEDVYHLDGGIVTYMEKFPAQEFEGTLYVFDGRITMDFDPKDKHVVIGKCDKCETPSERYVNCRNPRCNEHFICCEDCSEEDGKSYCSEECALIYSNK
jgi:UPF0176 protein